MKTFEFVKCCRCGGRGYQFISQPKRPCHHCKGTGRVLAMTEGALRHLKEMLGSCDRKLRKGECGECERIRSELRRATA